jgi:hypothetical protein
VEDGWKGEGGEEPDKEGGTPVSEEEEDTRQSHEEHMKQLAGMALTPATAQERLQSRKIFFHICPAVFPLHLSNLCIHPKLQQAIQ